MHETRLNLSEKFVCIPGLYVSALEMYRKRQEIITERNLSFLAMYEEV